MIGINATTVLAIGNIIMLVIWGLVIYSVVTVLKRLSEISRSLRNIEKKLGEDKLPVSPLPSGERTK